ncbi:hypothetical protein STPH2_1098 [Streptomyces sp. KO7888]|nr:hypothetical protein [Streptomyces sp. KO7888]
MVDTVERRRQVCVEHPRTLRVLPVERGVDGPDRVVTAAAGPEAVRLRLEPRFPLGLQCSQCHSLQAPVNNHGNPESALLCGPRFGDKHPLDGLRNPRSGAMLDPFGQCGLGLRKQHDFSVDSRRRASSVDLRDPSHAQERVRTGPEHQLL